MRDDQLGVWVALHQMPELLRDRRQPAPSVDEDRNVPLRRQRENRRQPLVVQQEPLRAWMQLDPPGAEIEAARRLLDRLLREVEADEGNQPPLGALRVG